MTTSELSKIEKQILIRVPRHKVWRALTNLEEFAHWFPGESLRRIYLPASARI